jgi:hypothetical protein
LADGYTYRSIDEVQSRLSPLLARQRLCMLPRVLERQGGFGEGATSVTLTVAFDIICAHDGSAHTVITFGEAQDQNDKATAKAMSAAYKIAILQTFCIPVQGLEDADKPQRCTGRFDHDPAPLQGWDQWATDIREMIETCASLDAIERVQQRYRVVLRYLSPERPELYPTHGAAVVSARIRNTNCVTAPPSDLGGGLPEAAGSIGVDAQSNEGVHVE